MLPHAVKHAELVLLHWKPLQVELLKFWQVFDEPTQRGAGVKVPDVATLVNKLKTEAKVI